MRIDILGCDGGNGVGYRPTCLRLNEQVLIDCGSLVGRLPDEAILKLTDIYLTHSHFDHIADLPFLFDNYFGRWPKPIELHGLPETIEAIQTHIFNEVIWPDFSVLPSPDEGQLKTRYIEPNTTYQTTAGLTLTPIESKHTVPTVGYLIEDDHSAVIFSGDTGPNPALWELANKTKNLKAVFIECSFPAELERIAKISGHHCTNTIGAELEQLKIDCDIYLWHAKVGCVEDLKQETRKLSHASQPLRWLRDFPVLEY